MAYHIPYHEGELAVQKHAGESRMARMNSGAISDQIPRGALGFIEQQPMVIVGSLSSQGDVWASILFNTPGFIRTVDRCTLVLSLTEFHLATGDPLWDNLKTNPQVGLLLIELETRRRLRINGSIRTTSDNGYFIDVAQAYPNCPKYIQSRRWRIPKTEPSHPKRPCRHGEQLKVTQQAWISNADIFFVASAHPKQGVDASHRGGKPGFVKVLNPHRLRIPDFGGNSMFNTLGNFASYPHAGLAFIDFERGRILQLTGRSELLWEMQDESGETGGTNRYWDIEIKTWQESESPLQLEWEFLDYSPFIPPVREAGQSAAAKLQLQVERVWRETERIKGFQLRSADGAPLPGFEPGAHLPVSVRLKNGEWALRNYSLLSDPRNNSHYRIAVLAELHGRGGSLYLHESLQAGDTLEVMSPRNHFPLEANAIHSILIAGGIGITPLLSMLYALKAGNKSFELHYSAKRLTDLAFREEIERLAGTQAHFYASGESSMTSMERLDLQSILAEPISGVHIYVCGPRPMIAFVRDLAKANDWPVEQIHFESFGAATSPKDRELAVTLAKSCKTVTVPASRSILDTLLDRGLAIPHDCKRGECSLCLTQVLDGEPDHRDLCLTSKERSESMCICVSRAKTQSLTLDL